MENGVYQPTQLAIVIPAYKAKFLPKTLDSIAAQTDKRFCVYIGDDCSPEDIGSIVEPYKGKFGLRRILEALILLRNGNDA